MEGAELPDRNGVIRGEHVPNKRDEGASGRGPLTTSEPAGEGNMSVPESLRDLEWELPHTFLGLDEEEDA